MNKFLSCTSGVCFVVFAVWFMMTLNLWVFGVSLLFQVGIFAPDMITRYRKAKRGTGN